jgi:hypothetical protein
MNWNDIETGAGIGTETTYSCERAPPPGWVPDITRDYILNVNVPGTLGSPYAITVRHVRGDLVGTVESASTADAIRQANELAAADAAARLHAEPDPVEYEWWRGLRRVSAA